MECIRRIMVILSAIQGNAEQEVTNARAIRFKTNIIQNLACPG